MVHLQGRLHAFLHPHFMSSLHDMDASGILVQCGTQLLLSSCCQPHSPGLGRFCNGTRVSPQT